MHEGISQSHLAAENVNRRPADGNKRRMNIVHIAIGGFHDQRKRIMTVLYKGQVPYKQLSIILAKKTFQAGADPEKNFWGGTPRHPPLDPHILGYHLEVNSVLKEMVIHFSSKIRNV